MKSSTFEADTVAVGDGQPVKLPDAFICPITMEIMDFPLMTRAGLNFDRDAILNWIGTNGTCPLTRQPMQPSDLVSNRKLQNEITRWRVDNGLIDDDSCEDQEIESSWESSLLSKFFMISVTNEQQERISKNSLNPDDNPSLLSLHQRAADHQQARRLDSSRSRVPFFRRRRVEGQRARQSALRRALDAALQIEG